MKISRNSIEYIRWMFEKYKYKKCGKYAKISYPHCVNGKDCISLGNFTKIGKDSWIEAIKSYEGETFKPDISIGNRVRIVGRCHLAAVKGIKIGDDVLIASDVFITDHAHGKFDKEEIKIPPIERKLYSKGQIEIEDNVWIGEKVTILSGVKIGKNAIIGANSVVTHDVPENCIVAGAPARIIKQIDID